MRPDGDSPEDGGGGGLGGLGSLDDLAVVKPVGALDEEGGLRQVAAEDGGGLVPDLDGLSDDRQGFGGTEGNMTWYSSFSKHKMSILRGVAHVYRLRRQCCPT